MSFERIVMTDSKTLLLSGLLAINLNDLPCAGRYWRVEEIRVENEVWDTQQNRQWKGIAFRMRDAELRLRDRFDRRCGAVLRLHALQQMKDFPNSFGVVWRLSHLKLNEYSYQKNVEWNWSTDGKKLNRFGKMLEVDQGFIDNAGHWYQPVRANQALLATA